MFSLEHPDFSLIPHPDDPTQWRGVAKTQEGIKSLLALWGTPKDDPEHPLCVFSWHPTPNALSALRTHFSDITVRPLDEADHRIVWDTQKTQAWLTPLRETHTFTLSVISQIAPEKGVQPCKVSVHLNGECEMTLNGVTTPLRSDPFFFWEKDNLFQHQNTVVIPAKADEVRRAVIAGSAGVHHPERKSGFWGHPLEQAYRFAKTGMWPHGWTPGHVSSISFDWNAEPWAAPFFTHCVHAYMTSENTTLAELEGSAKEAYEALCFMSAKWHPLFRTVMQSLPIETQKEKWFENASEFEAGLWFACPRSGIETALDNPRQCSGYEARTAFQTAVQSDDRFFFDTLKDVFDVFNRRRSEAFSVLDDKDKTPWQDIYRLWSLFEGFREHHTEAGMSRFVGALVDEDRPFQASLVLSPSMVRAFEDPAFLKRLDTTVFWKRLEDAPHRHPTWEALLEQSLLSGLTKPPLDMKKSQGIGARSE
jgi:hypothetical protein